MGPAPSLTERIVSETVIHSDGQCKDTPRERCLFTCYLLAVMLAIDGLRLACGGQSLVVETPHVWLLLWVAAKLDARGIRALSPLLDAVLRARWIARELLGQVSRADTTRSGCRVIVCDGERNCRLTKFQAWRSG